MAAFKAGKLPAGQTSSICGLSDAAKAVDAVFMALPDQQSGQGGSWLDKTTTMPALKLRGLNAYQILPTS
jgi:hypothetical protein